MGFDTVMEDKKGDWEVKNMVNEITRGKELVGQLQIHLMNNGPPSSWHEAHEFLIIRILTSYEKVLTWATSIGDLQDPQTSTGVKIRMLESPPLPTEISSSGESESEHEQYLKDTSRKRSISIRDLQDEANIQMSESTLSCAESLGQSRQQQHSFKKSVKTDVGLVDLRQDKDNHTWRKYGQKPILGRNHHREYFKCVDRRGCSGRKQVQQSDKDPTKFTIKYNGKHTCTQASHNNNVCPSPSSAEQRQKSQVDTTLSLSCATISVVTQDYKDNPRQQTFSSFHPTSSSSDVTHSFVSPEISGTSYLSVAEAEKGDLICQYFSESSEIVDKNSASTTPSITMDLELNLELNL